MSASLAEKISALKWVPNGEVDDTRFEKLFDDLSSYSSSESGLTELFSAGLLDVLKVRFIAPHCLLVIMI